MGCLLPLRTTHVHACVHVPTKTKRCMHTALMCLQCVRGNLTKDDSINILINKLKHPYLSQ